jgi:hypothetical protein
MLPPKPHRDYSICIKCHNSWQLHKTGECTSCRQKPCLLCGVSCTAPKGICRICHDNRPRSVRGTNILIDSIKPDMRSRYFIESVDKSRDTGEIHSLICSEGDIYDRDDLRTVE